MAAESAAAELTLRQLVERFASDSDVEFLPKAGRSHAGLQVYAFGSVSIAIDNAAQSIWAQTGDRWEPVSLDQLLKLSQGRRRGG